MHQDIAFALAEMSDLEGHFRDLPAKIRAFAMLVGHSVVKRSMPARPQHPPHVRMDGFPGPTVRPVAKRASARAITSHVTKDEIHGLVFRLFLAVASAKHLAESFSCDEPIHGSIDPGEHPAGMVGGDDVSARARPLIDLQPVAGLLFDLTAAHSCPPSAPFFHGGNHQQRETDHPAANDPDFDLHRARYPARESSVLSFRTQFNLVMLLPCASMLSISHTSPSVISILAASLGLATPP